MARSRSQSLPRRTCKTAATCGEDGILALARHAFGYGTARGVIRGIGDDAAVLEPPAAGMLELLTTDTLVAGTHFTPAQPPRAVGGKAMAVNISDVAAMGGVPRHAVVSLAVPAKTPIRYLRELMAGMQRAAEAFGIAVVGGDIVGSPVLAITVTMTGQVEPECLCCRSGAKPGHFIVVTGPLGGAVRSGKHLRFTPRLAEARWLVRHARPSAMMDLSDGLATDAARLAEASDVQVRLASYALPRRRGCSSKAALFDGEDFELLCAFAPATLTAQVQKAYAARFGLPLTVIGFAVRGAPCVMLDGRRMPAGGFDHFAPQR